MIAFTLSQKGSNGIRRPIGQIERGKIIASRGKKICMATILCSKCLDPSEVGISHTYQGRIV
jgi:hypothetical protein